jgi:cysteinyl-tRNA synthetase
MQLYNSRTRKIEEFKSLIPGQVKMYTCGPTVYNYAHIGNLRTYTLSDLIYKAFVFSGYKVTHTMNITDFGHIVGDADSGEDKMSLGLKRENLPRTIEGMKQLADIYSKAFVKDMEKVHIQKPEFLPRAIEHLNTYIDMISLLLEKGFAYKTDDAIYFETEKFPTYGEMALIDRNKDEQSRITTGSEKKDSKDFALWKFVDETSLVGFDSLFGKGFPGWHIECSGMAKKFLGDSIDIHLGGIDLRNIHHTNEIAQSECANGKVFSNFFLHGEFIDINGVKMSKSLNNELTLRSIEEKNFSPLALRYLFLQTHYRKKLDFTFESLEASQNALTKLQKNILNLQHYDSVDVSEKYISLFKESLNDDLNIAGALATLWTMLKDDEVTDNQKYFTALEMDQVLSLDLGKQNEKEITPEIQELIDLRNKYRADKNWAESDKIRDQLKSLGYEINDK